MLGLCRNAGSFSVKSAWRSQLEWPGRNSLNNPKSAGLDAYICLRLFLGLNLLRNSLLLYALVRSS